MDKKAIQEAMRKVIADMTENEITVIEFFRRVLDIAPTPGVTAESLCERMKIRSDITVIVKN